MLLSSLCTGLNMTVVCEHISMQHLANVNFNANFVLQFVWSSFENAAFIAWWILELLINTPNLGLTFLTAVSEVAFLLILWKFVLNSEEENLAFSNHSLLELQIWKSFYCIVQLGEESSSCTTDTFLFALMSCLCWLCD